MLRRHNRLLIALHVISDAFLGILAFLAAYQLRFSTGLIPITKGTPPLENYLYVLPFVAGLVPLAFQLQGLYRLRRGRPGSMTSSRFSSAPSSRSSSASSPRRTSRSISRPVPRGKAAPSRCRRRRGPFSSC